MPQFIDHHSGEIQDIIGRIPSWTLRRGTTVITCLVCLLLLAAWLIRYPDSVTLPFNSSAANPPVKVIAQHNGKISALNVKNKQHVNEQQIIGIIENPGKTEDIRFLQQLITRMDTSTQLPQITCPDNLQTGTLQSDYKTFLRATLSKDGAAIFAAADKLKAGISQWEKEYVLKAPVAGRLVYLQSSMNVTAGQAVFVVVSETAVSDVSLQLPVKQANRVRENQEVMIKLYRYPFMEYGILKANVAYISDFVMDSSYIVHLSFPNGFVSTKNKTLALGPGSTGTAEIITSDKSILQRIFNGIFGPAER